MISASQKLPPKKQAIAELIRDELIQTMNKFPDLCGRGTNQYFSLEEYILENGQPVELTPVIASTMPEQSCYANAEAVAWRYPGDMHYMEGYAGWIHPERGTLQVFQHAWLWGSCNRLHLDPTFRYPGVVALGCLFPIRPAASTLVSLRDVDPQNQALLTDEVMRSIGLRGLSTIGTIHALCSPKSRSAADVFSAGLIESTRGIRFNPTKPENDERAAARKSPR